MNRRLINAMAAQYATPEVSGDGLVSWEHGKKCVIPSVKLYGAAVQETLKGINLFDANMQYTPSKALDPNTGLPASWGGAWGLSDYIACEPSTTYTRSYDIDTGRVCVAFYDADQSMIGFSTASGVFTTPDDCAFVRLNLIINNIPTCMLVVGEYTAATMPPYEPYCGGIPAPNPGYPIMPVCNNGVFAARGKNVFDAEGFAQELLALDGSSRVTVDGRDCVRFSNQKAYQHGAYVPFTVREHTQYTIKISVKADGLADGFGSLLIIVYYTDGTKATIFSRTVTAAQDWCTAVVMTEAGKTVSYLRLSYGTIWYWYIDSSIQMAEGVYTADTMPPYTPYYDGGQAQAPERWAIPGTEYRDEWDCQTGWGIRRVKKLVLDGTERWLRYAQGVYYTLALPDAIYSENIYCMCTHWVSHASADGSRYTYGCWLQSTAAYPRFYVAHDFAGVEELTSFLSAQYAAGTPVTVWYALADPEPFFSLPTRLTMPTGYGQIIQVSGDVPDCPITAKYLTHR